MVVRAIVVLLCLTGCDRLFGLEHLEPPPDGGRGDADVREDAGGDTGDGGPLCPLSYDIQLPDSPTRYRYAVTNTSWDAAESDCASDTTGGTHLIVLDDDRERSELMTALTARGLTDSVWIGLSDRVSEGVWLWVTAQEVSRPPLTSPPWAAGQPDDAAGAQDCVRILGPQSVSPTLLDDSECSSTLDYVCECDGYAPVGGTNF